MNRPVIFFFLAGIAAILVILILPGFLDWAINTRSFRYRLNVTVEIDGQKRTGSTVVDIFGRSTWPFTSLLDMPHRWAARGALFEVPQSELPPLARFRDVADPTTLEAVPSNDLASICGEGAKWIGATLQLTDDPAVLTINSTLPWLNRYEGRDVGELAKYASLGGPARINISSYYNFVCLAR